MAAKGVLGDLNPLGDGSCRSLADNGARVPKILPTVAAELEGSLTGIIVATPPEPVGGAAGKNSPWRRRRRRRRRGFMEAPAGGDDVGGRDFYY